MIKKFLYINFFLVYLIDKNGLVLGFDKTCLKIQSCSWACRRLLVLASWSQRHWWQRMIVLNQNSLSADEKPDYLHPKSCHVPESNKLWKDKVRFEQLIRGVCLQWLICVLQANIWKKTMICKRNNVTDLSFIILYWLTSDGQNGWIAYITKISYASSLRFSCGFLISVHYSSCSSVPGLFASPVLAKQALFGVYNNRSLFEHSTFRYFDYIGFAIRWSFSMKICYRSSQSFGAPMPKTECRLR